MCSVCLVCMNFNTEECIKNMLDSICMPSTCDLHIVIVDNSNSINPNKPLCDIDRFNSFEILSPGSNLGYLGGVEWLVNYRPELKLVNYLCLVNPDIVFNSSFFSILSCLSINKKVGVIAPDITNMPSGVSANPLLDQRLSHLSILLKILFHSNSAFYFIYESLHNIKKNLSGLFRKNSKSNKRVKKKIYAPHGSLIIFTKEFLKLPNAFTHISFLYSEELYIAEIANENNLEIQMTQELKALHFEHASTGTLSNKIKVRYAFNSLLGVYKRFYTE